MELGSSETENMLIRQLFGGVWHGESKGRMVWGAQGAYGMGSPRGVWHGEPKGYMAWVAQGAYGMGEWRMAYGVWRMAYGMGKFFLAMVIVLLHGLRFRKKSWTNVFDKGKVQDRISFKKF
jgi:hypothetical protein